MKPIVHYSEYDDFTGIHVHHRALVKVKDHPSAGPGWVNTTPVEYIHRCIGLILGFETENTRYVYEKE